MRDILNNLIDLRHPLLQEDEALGTVRCPVRHFREHADGPVRTGGMMRGTVATSSSGPIAPGSWSAFVFTLPRQSTLTPSQPLAHGLYSLLN